MCSLLYKPNWYKWQCGISQLDIRLRALVSTQCSSSSELLRSLVRVKGAVFITSDVIIIIMDSNVVEDKQAVPGIKLQRKCPSSWTCSPGMLFIYSLYSSIIQFQSHVNWHPYAVTCPTQFISNIYYILVYQFITIFIHMFFFLILLILWNNYRITRAMTGTSVKSVCHVQIYKLEI